MSNVSNHSFHYDSSLVLEDGAGAITSTAIGSGGALNLGGGVWEGYVVVDLTAIDVSETDNVYTLYFEGSVTGGYTDTEKVAAMIFGHSTATGDAATTTVGRFHMPIHNVKKDTVYNYIRVNVVAAGTSKSITAKVWLTSQR